ncbi:MAG: nitroreductase family protein [Candidatus Thorarchaeota archaeon]
MFSHYIDAFLYLYVSIFLIVMEFMDIIRYRRSIRKYIERDVEDAKIHQILEAGRWAPSASNRQPWHFIIVKDPAMRKKLAAIHPYGGFMAESPVVIVVLGDPNKSPKYHLADPHNAVQNMILAAYAQGLGSCWMGVRDTDIEPKFKALLQVPDYLRVICSISIGYHEIQVTRTREPLENLVSYELFSKR